MSRLIPVVLSGGSGTRLWPLSTPARPKQLHALVGDRPMLVETVRRLDGLGADSPVIVCGEAHADALRAVLHGDEAQVVAEPIGRNTAPAIAVVALTADPDDVLLVLPADHLVADVDAFAAAMRSAVDLARSGHLVTFGIVATHPATGYGWIEPGDPVDGARAVASFREKPDAATAAEYLAAGWLWNSGMFCFRVGTFLDELGAHRPDVLVATRKALGEGGIDPAAYEAVPSVSVDHAVMEPTDRAVVLPLDAGWSDIGSWASLWEVLDKDADGNAVVGEALLVDTRDSLVYTDGRPVAVFGQSGVAVVAGDDGVVVVPLDESQQVREAAKRFGG